MSSGEPKFVYWDACVFLSYVENNPERAPLLDLLMDEADAGNLRIIASMETQVEVAFVAQERASGVLSAQTEADIEALWLPSSPVEVVDLSSPIATRARGLIRQGLPRRWALKPKDAVHLATAQQLGAEVFNTYDKPLRKYATDIGIPILRPDESHLRIV